MMAASFSNEEVCAQKSRTVRTRQDVSNFLGEGCPGFPTSIHEVPWDLMDTNMFTTGPLSHVPY